jgi:uncharacterized protein YbaP (TraB family)
MNNRSTFLFYISYMLQFFFRVFLFGLISSSSLIAQNNTLLYQLKKNGHNDIFVFGTIHVAKNELFTINNSLNSVLKKVDSAYFEIIPNEFEMMQAIQPYLYQSDTLALKNYLNPQQLKIVSKFLTQHFGNDKFINFHPLVINLSIHQTFYSKIDSKAMDMYFLEKMEKYKKGVGQLECIQCQLDLFNQRPVYQQINEVLNTIENYEKHKNDLQKLFDIYATQNLDSIYEFMLQEMNTDENKSFYLEVLLNKRNREMVKKIHAFSKNSMNIYFIGAAHLPGENGILNLLQQQGFTIVPLK